MRSPFAVAWLGLAASGCVLDWTLPSEKQELGQDDAGGTADASVDAESEVACSSAQCGTGGICVPTAEGFDCHCVDGYARGENGRCADVDECSGPTSSCSVHATCANLAGGHRCECGPGFVGDGSSCRGDAIKIAAGDGSTCAVLSNGSLWCWGAAPGRMLPFTVDPKQVPFSNVPRRMGDAEDWFDIGVSDQLVCGLRGSGTLSCWGDSLLDEAGRPRTVEAALVVGDPGAYVDLVVGGGKVCALRRSGGATCASAIGTSAFVDVMEYPDARSLYRVGDANAGRLSLEAFTATTWDGHCGTTDTGAARCKAVYDEVEEPQGVSKPIAISGGIHVGCAIENGQLLCWRGYPGALELVSDMASMEFVASPVGTRNDWADLASGYGHVCARSSDGDIGCFGMNGWGQLGRESSSVASPARVGTDSDWTAVSVGGGWTCGLRAALGWQCWGRVPARGWGGIADHYFATSGESTVATLPAPSTELVSLQAGSGSGIQSALCGISGGGRAHCWRPPVDASTGGWGAASIMELAGETGWTQVALGTDPTSNVEICGVRDGSLLCGSDTDMRSRSALSGWTLVQTSGWHRCALRAGELYCWGANDTGQLGTGLSANSDAPTRIGDARDWSSVAVSSGFAKRGVVGTSCGIRAGELYCWGDNGYGQLGNVLAGEFELTPKRVGEGADWKMVALARGDGFFACALRVGGGLFCWGDNQAGQLGQGDFTPRREPTQVGTFNDWTALSVHGGPSLGMVHGHSCAIRQQQLYCWGDNSYGQLGVVPERAFRSVEWEQ